MDTGTLTVRVKGVPFPIQFADWTHDRLYHTVEFQGGDSVEIIAFVGAQGSPIPGGSRVLTLVDTNITRSGDTGLQAGWEMLVYSIQVEVVREVAATTSAFALQDNGANQVSRPVHVGGYDPAVTNGGVLFDFMRKVYHRFSVNNKTQSEGAIAEYPQGSGIHVFSNGTSVEVASNGPPSPRDQSAMVLPIWLKPNIGYKASFAPQASLGIANGGAFDTTTYPGGYFNWSGLTAPTLGFDVRETLEGLVKRPVA